MTAAPRLRSTYRLQLTRQFTLHDAREIVPYLQSLGISHLYLSPVLQARHGSTHGYDVADPTKISQELGGDEAFRALAAAVHERGMGILLDVVPNHMGIGPDNPFWDDVLAHGERSRYARWFDVEWTAHPKHKLVLPVLGDEREAVLARGELGLDISESGGVRLTYFDHHFPLDPARVPEQLQLVQFDPNAKDAALAWISGDEGRARLRALIDDQHYALVHWKVAPTSINYRRFFDVNDLAALRVEDDDVFDETHALVLKLVEEGVIDALRIDHVDGLRDPLGYLQRLRSEVANRTRSSDDPHAFPIFVEKILSPGEHLRADWPIQGTTGYEFMNDLATLFIHADGARRIEDAYRRHRRIAQRERPVQFEDVAREGKLLVLRGALRADLLRLARRLAAAEERSGERVTRVDVRVLADGLTQLIASLPVYRTYIDGRSVLPHDDDREVIERAVARAQEHLKPEEHAVVARVARAFLSPLVADSPKRDARLDFVLRFQQTSGPATAKGVEDTALYRYVPLASRNEVGGEPDRPLHDAVQRIHAANGERARSWPASLLATNTHDTKRSADVRARIHVLSEVPDEWMRHVTRWRRLNRAHRTIVKGKLVPDTSTEWLFYQTLVGLWPAPRTGRRADDLPASEWIEAACERLREYMMKAVKEAKLLTSWTEPDQAYEEAITKFINGAFDTRGDSPFLSDVARFVALVSRAGIWNSLARVVVHYTSPGTPDTYQGDECWTYTLVDPDNRRRVAFDRRAAMLSELQTIFPDSIDAAMRAARLRDFLRTPEDDRLKLLVAWQVLKARNTAPDLFTRGTYEPLSVEGSLDDHVFAFARVSGIHSALTIVPRQLGKLGMLGHAGGVAADAWQDTRLRLPASLAAGRWRSVFSGEEIAARNGVLEMRAIFSEMPLALLLTT